MESPRRAPAVEKNVNEIQANDIRVRVIGIVRRTNDGFYLEDETGGIKINSENLRENQKVRIFGRPLDTGKNLELSVELVQDMGMLNENLFKRVRLLMNKEV